MAKYGEDDINVLHPSLRSIYLKPEKSLGLDKDKVTVDLLRDVFRKNCIALMGEFANAGKPKLDERQLILAYHMSRGTVKGTANQVKALMETSPYFDFHPQYMLPLLRPVKSNMQYNKEFRAFRMLAVVYTPDQNFQLSNILDWSTTYTFAVEYVLRRHTIQKKYEDFVKLNQELEQELLTLPTFPQGATGLGQTASKGLELQEYVRRLHHSLADRGVYSPRLMKFLAVDYEQVQTEEEGAFVLTLDSPSLPPNTAWHFIDEQWLDKWRTYVRGRAPRRYFPPGKITNAHIYTQWRLYDDAVKAAQKVSEDDSVLLQQAALTQHRRGFAHMVLKLTRSENHVQNNHKSDEKQGRMRRLSDVFARKRSVADEQGGEEGGGGDEAVTDDEEEIEEKNDENDDENDEENDDENENEGDGEGLRESEDKRDAKAEGDDADEDEEGDHTHKALVRGKSHMFRKAKRLEQTREKRAKRLQKKLDQQAQTQAALLREVPKLVAIRDYRCVNFNVFRFLQIVHGGGPVISRELADLYSPVAYSFLHAVVLVQTRIRIKVARLQLEALRMQQLSLSYAGKLFLVKEAQRFIGQRAQQQMEANRQERIARNLETAATFTQNLWRLKKKYFLEDTLVAKRKEQEAFQVVQRFHGDVPNASVFGQVVSDLKPIVQVGNTNVYARVLADSDGGLPFTLQRVVGTEQAQICTSTDESRFVVHSLLLAINRVPTSTLTYEQIKERLAQAKYPLHLELEKPFDPFYLPSLCTVVTLKTQGSLRVAIYAAFKLAMVRGIRLIKHSSTNLLSSHATILRINDHALLYQTSAKDPEHLWTRLSLFDLKFVRDGRTSEAVQLRAMQRVDVARCFELVLEERSLVFEFPRLDKELQQLMKQRHKLDEQVQKISSALQQLEDEEESEEVDESSRSHNNNNNNNKQLKKVNNNKVRFQLSSSFSSDNHHLDSDDLHTHTHTQQQRASQHDRQEAIAQLFEQKRAVAVSQRQLDQEIDELRRLLSFHQVLVRAVAKRRDSSSFVDAGIDADADGDEDEDDLLRAFRPDLLSGHTGARSVQVHAEDKAPPDDADDNADMDDQDYALCSDFRAQNEAWLLKRVFLANLKRLIAEIRGTQVFVNKTGLPIRRRKQKAALKRIEG